MSQHNIIPASLAIKSMRDSGYKTAAHALAELIDNSIQAKATNIHLICIDQKKSIGTSRVTKQVEQIAIFDNGIGMSPYTLQQALQFGGGSHRDDPNGIGKFGMGLPSATISQCRRLDVYSWRNNKCFYTYLDVNEIEQGSLQVIPEPVEKNIPNKWLTAIGDDYSNEHGTLVIWSDLDRVVWKTSKSIYTHSEKIIGRMYRHFIADERIKVRFKSFLDEIALSKENDCLFKVNDPLFLYKNSILPELPGDYVNESFFEPFGETEKIEVELNDGTKGTVEIKYSRVNKSIHQAINRECSGQVGSTKYGKLAAENNGVSIVRSGREIKLTDIFSRKDVRERFYGVEISFLPVLDELFGVTFDKQDVVNFETINLEIEAENEGVDTHNREDYENFKDEFRKNRSNRYWIHYIVTSVNKNIRELEKHIKTLKDDDGKSSENNSSTDLFGAEKISKQIADQRNKENRATNSDKEFKRTDITDEEKKANVKEHLTLHNIDPVEAGEIASAIIDNDCNVKFIEQPLSGKIFFDVSRESGVIIIYLNTNHVFFKFYSQFDNEKKELMKLVLIAWAQCEDDASKNDREEMEDIRIKWGKVMREYLDKLNEE